MFRKIILSIAFVLLIVTSAFCLTRIGAFLINDIDSSIADVEYFGFNTSYNTEWYILELTSATARYLRGGSNYDVYWSSRTLNTYYPFSEINAHVQN